MTNRPAASLACGVLLVAALVDSAGCTGRQPEAGPPVSEDTRQLFRDRCALCHGIDGRGTPMSQGSADFTDTDWRAAARIEDLIVVINDGRGDMLGFSDVLRPKEIADLAAALKQGQ